MASVTAAYKMSGTVLAGHSIRVSQAKVCCFAVLKNDDDGPPSW